MATACEAYVAIRQEMVKQQNCWAHTRRKFEEQLATSQLAAEALALIAPITAIEDEIDGEPPGVRLEARRRRSRPLVDAFWVWCKERQEDPALTPKHPTPKQSAMPLPGRQRWRCSSMTRTCRL